MKRAALIGIDYDKFLNITPKTLNIYLNAYEEKQKYEAKESIYQAYLISRFVWQKKIDIDKIMDKIDKPKPKIMTDEAMLQQVKMLNAIFGGSVNTCKS